MPRLEYFIVAESFSVDRDTNAVSIFNVYNERKVDSFPVDLPRMVAISCWIASADEIRDKADAQAAIVIKNGNSSSGPHRFNFTCDAKIRHLIIELSDYQVQHPGTLEIELLLNDSHEATHQVDFQLITTD